MNADGTGLVQRTATPTQELDAVWAPADTALLFEAIADTSVAFQVLSLAGGRNAVRPLALAGDFLEWSPTGEWVAYHAADGIRLASPAGGPSRLLVGQRARRGEAFPLVLGSGREDALLPLAAPTGWTIRAIPLDGGPSRPLVTFDDPARQPTRYGFATDGRTFYLTLGSHESDLSVMELDRRLHQPSRRGATSWTWPREQSAAGRVHQCGTSLSACSPRSAERSRGRCRRSCRRHRHTRRSMSARVSLTSASWMPSLASFAGHEQLAEVREAQAVAGLGVDAIALKSMAVGSGTLVHR